MLSFRPPFFSVHFPARGDPRTSSPACQTNTNSHACPPPQEKLHSVNCFVTCFLFNSVGVRLSHAWKHSIISLSDKITHYVVMALVTHRLKGFDHDIYSQKVVCRPSPANGLSYSETTLCHLRDSCEPPCFPLFYILMKPEAGEKNGGWEEQDTFSRIFSIFFFSKRLKIAVLHSHML